MIDIEEMVANDPVESVRHFVRLESYLKALKDEIIRHAEKNGEIKSIQGVSVTKRTRKNESLDLEKSASILGEAGFDVLDICDIRLTEESIVAKLGEENGYKLISELKASGATKVSTTTYWRMQAR